MSATKRLGLDELRGELISMLPQRPPDYPEEQVTDSTNATPPLTPSVNRA
ncbi:MAG: hypothetical protein IPJ46_22735 [Anaerolineales bacterium]|nr:hypothetical protein [Anaerolineales bacterium]